MKKKILRFAALWLALAALVFVYTDRQEYTWSFAGEDLGAIVHGEEQAQAHEDDAERRLALEREDAAQRLEQGYGVKKNLYGGAAKTKDAVDDQYGLNLMWGEYEVIVSANLTEETPVRVYSAGRQSFVSGGEAVLAAGAGEQRLTFTLTDSAERVALACDVPAGAQVDSVTVRRSGAGVFSRDLAAYAALAGGVLSWLLALSFDRRPVGRGRRRDALVIVMTALFASMPLLWNGLYDGHDLFFHLNRIEGIAAGLRAGQLPVRIHASTVLGYGYAAPQFYPELFLYLPAVMRNLGVSLCACVCIFEMLINFATALSCYLSARSLFGERRIALGASMLYTLCSYRIANLYVRGTIGESLAMVFFPVLILALYEVLVRDERRWPLLALAMTGIFMSHLLSTMFAAAMCVISAAVCLPRLVRAPRRILACVKAALVMLLCSVWFLVPMLSYSAAGISTSVAIDAYDHVLRLGGYFVGFAGEVLELADEVKDFAYTIGTVPGLTLMLGCALAAVSLYANGMKCAVDRLCLVLLAFSGVLLLGATEFFPWEWGCMLPRPYSTFFMQIQYPWRLVSVAAPMMAMAGAWGFMRREAHRTQALFAVAALSVVFSGYMMQLFVQDVPLLRQDSYCDTRIEQYEYMYENTQKNTLAPGEIAAARAPEYAVRNYSKQGTNLSFTLDVPKGSAYTDVPLLYYPNYRAQANGMECRIQKGDNNVLRIVGVPEGMGVEIRIWYEAPVLWIAAQAVSAGGALLLAAALRRMRRRQAA